MTIRCKHCGRYFKEAGPRDAHQAVCVESHERRDHLRSNPRIKYGTRVVFVTDNKPFWKGPRMLVPTVEIDTRSGAVLMNVNANQDLNLLFDHDNASKEQIDKAMDILTKHLRAT